MIRAVAICAALLLPLASTAETNPAEVAEQAIEALDAAADSLARAETSSDRIRSLTKTVHAYEEGLSALREGVRQATLRERRLKAALEEERAEMATLLGALLSMQTSPETLVLLHPSGPVENARAAMIFADIMPGVQSELARLNAQLSELALLQSLQKNALGVLEDGLAGVQAARSELSKAVQERTARSRVSDIDVATMQALVNSSDTLAGFAASLATAVEPEASADVHSFADAAGQLPPPVDGEIIAEFRRPDAGGVRRPGVLVAAPAGVLVTAPHAGTLRYAGPLLELGEVSILEPEAGYLLILAGLGQAFGTQGEIVEFGDPLGLMGGGIPSAEQILIETRNGNGQDRTETLYIELRQGDTPLDPMEWFGFASE